MQYGYVVELREFTILYVSKRGVAAAWCKEMLAHKSAFNNKQVFRVKEFRDVNFVN